MNRVGSFQLAEYNNTFLFGVRYAFNGPPPPPPPAPVAAPAPAVQPARSYLVFFDWDQAKLTDRARQIVKEAAENSTHVQFTQIEVNGYTDTSGRRSITNVCRSVGRKRWPPNWCGMACRRAQSRSRASARRTCWFQRAPTCVSHRTGGSRSSSAEGSQEPRIASGAPVTSHATAGRAAPAGGRRRRTGPNRRGSQTGPAAQHSRHRTGARPRAGRGTMQFLQIACGGGCLPNRIDLPAADRSFMSRAAHWLGTCPSARRRRSAIPGISRLPCAGAGSCG